MSEKEITIEEQITGLEIILERYLRPESEKCLKAALATLRRLNDFLSEESDFKLEWGCRSFGPERSRRELED